MIGPNMIQCALMMQLTNNIVAYDPYAPGVEGAVEEMYHCSFPGVNLSWTNDKAVAFKDAKYIVTSGGAPRKAGMTREDLLKGNTEIAAEFEKDIKKYCPDVEHVTIVFNPADITGLVTLVHSGIHPSKNKYAGCFRFYPITNCISTIFQYTSKRGDNTTYIWWSWWSNGRFFLNL